MLYNIKVPRDNKYGYANLIVETHKEYTLEELKERLYDTNLDEDIKDDLSFAHEMHPENYNMKFFFIKHGFKVIEIKEDK